MRDFCRVFILAASSSMSPTSSAENSARVRQSRPERGEGGGGVWSSCGIMALSGHGDGIGPCNPHQGLEAASKGIERSSYLRSAHGERRREAYRGAPDQVDENPFSQRVLEERLPEARVAEIQGEQEPLPARLGAGNPGRQRLQGVLEDSPLEPHLLEEDGIVDHAQNSPDRSHRERVAPEGRAVVARSQSRALFSSEHRADGEAAAEALGAREHVGDYTRALVGVEVPRAPSPGLDLVEDEEGTKLIAQLAQPPQETLRRHVDAALALDRLDQDRRGLRPG